MSLHNAPSLIGSVDLCRVDPIYRPRAIGEADGATIGLPENDSGCEPGIPTVIVYLLMPLAAGPGNAALRRVRRQRLRAFVKPARGGQLSPMLTRLCCTTWVSGSPA